MEDLDDDQRRAHHTSIIEQVLNDHFWGVRRIPAVAEGGVEMWRTLDGDIITAWHSVLEGIHPDGRVEDVAREAARLVRDRPGAQVAIRYRDGVVTAVLLGERRHTDPS